MERIYAVGAGVLVGSTAAMYACGPVSIAPDAVLPASAASIYLIGHGTWLSGGRRKVLGETMRAFGAWIMAVLLTLVASVAATPWTAAPADWLLSAPERWVGLTHPWAADLSYRLGLLPVLQAAYDSFLLQGYLLILYWGFARGNTRRLWEACTAFVLCGIVALPVYLLLPAEGPWAYYGEPGLTPSWLIEWRAMRAGPYAINAFNGYIGAPSYHAVFAVLLTYLWWHTPVRRAGVALNVIMLFATWVVGHHYLVDIAVGLALALSALRFVRRLP